MKTTLIIGASHKPERYSNKAQKLLTEHGHPVILYNPRGGEILGEPVINHLDSLSTEIDTITLYVNPKALKSLIPTLIALKPRRVIFNPGTEEQSLENQIKEAGIIAEQACTLVLLHSGQY